MGLKFKDFINELSKSDLLEYEVDSYNLSLHILGNEINIISVANDYTAMTAECILPLGNTLTNAGIKIESYIRTKNRSNIFNRLLIALMRYDTCNFIKDDIYFRGFKISYDGNYSIVAESEDGDKFNFTIVDNDPDMTKLAEKINRFLK